MYLYVDIVSINQLADLHFNCKIYDYVYYIVSINQLADVYKYVYIVSMNQLTHLPFNCKIYYLFHLYINFKTLNFNLILCT